MTRYREEDPHTGLFASLFGTSAVVHRSRFEIDLNRERHEAVYLTPKEAWGLEIWEEDPSEELVAESRSLHDSFYGQLGTALDEMAAEHGGFVLYDLHSYNHRRGGPDGPADPAEENPTINLGTGSLPGQWRAVARAFLASMSAATLDGGPIDARENVRFRGRQVATFVHDRYGDIGCALAIEVKKVFMDEWSGEFFPDVHRALGSALTASAAPVLDAWRRSARR